MKHHYFLLLSAVADAFQKVDFADLAAPMYDVTDYGVDVRKISLKQTSNIVSAETHALAAHSYHRVTASGSQLFKKKNKTSFFRGVAFCIPEAYLSATQASNKELLRLDAGNDISPAMESSLREKDWKPDIIEVMKNQKNCEYVVNLAVGSTRELVPVVPDTGSANLWLVSDLCTLPRCGLLKQYHPSLSKHAQKLGDSEVYAGFGTAGLRGVHFLDDVKLEDTILEQHRIGAITNFTGEVWNTAEISGILGLSFPALSNYDGSSFFDRLMKKKVLQENQFTFFISPWGREEYSAFLLGKVDKSLYNGELSCFPVPDHLERFWTVNVNKVTLRYKDGRKPEVEFDGPKQIIFDSGTNLYSVDNKEDLIKFMPIVPGADPSVFERELYNLPTIVWHVPTTEPGKVKEIAILPEEYYVTRASDSEKKAKSHYPGFMGIQNGEPQGPSWMFGQLFMRYWVTTYRRGAEKGTSSVCVAPTNMSDAAIAKLKTLDRKKTEPVGTKTKG